MKQEIQVVTDMFDATKEEINNKIQEDIDSVKEELTTVSANVAQILDLITNM